MTIRIITAILAIVIYAGCKPKPEKAPPSTAPLLDADRAFSQMSEKKGLRSAYMDYIDSNGVLLRPSSLPIVGADAVDFISQSNDTSFIMTWEPKAATIGDAADLGYTYGIFSFKSKSEDSVYYGTYVTIWKKQPDGRWKFILQSANQDIE
jgi:ketosteroid isomerase-like protein